MPEPASIVILSGGLISILLKYARTKFNQIKVFFDIIFSFIALVLISPLMLLIALGVKLTSKGPVFYTQERVGKDGEHFEIIKFRTMVDKAEKKTGIVWSQSQDPRLTRYGKWLRDHHLDELPQFINVLKGQMSIIGPRPERPHFVNKFEKSIPGYNRRLKVKPGITGLAQTRQSYDITLDDVKRKLSMDVMYIREMCWMVDLRIFFQTIRVLLTGKIPEPKKARKETGTPLPSSR